jgi:hypothetical protein
VEIAAATPAVQDGRIYIERVNAQFKALLNGGRGHPEFGDGIRYAIERGWLWMHESGTYLKLMPPGQDLLASKGSTVSNRPSQGPSPCWERGGS